MRQPWHSFFTPRKSSSRRGIFRYRVSRSLAARMKRGRAVMEKYTTGTRPLRRQSGCKEEGNSYIARDVCGLVYRRRDISSRRLSGKKVASRPFARIASEQTIPPDARHFSSAVVTHRHHRQLFLLWLRRSIEQGSFDGDESAPHVRFFTGYHRYHISLFRRT